MFRSFFRVVVVVVVVLSFTLSLAQAGQTGPQSSRQPVVQTVMSGWLGAAVQWLTGLVAGKPASGSGRHPVHTKGSCIDPWGHNLCP